MVMPLAAVKANLPTVALVAESETVQLEFVTVGTVYDPTIALPAEVAKVKLFAFEKLRV
jgi:hypothetical protein